MAGGTLTISRFLFPRASLQEGGRGTTEDSGEAAPQHVPKALSAEPQWLLPQPVGQMSRECMFLGSLSRHNKDLERRTLKPSAHHSSRVLDKPCYNS